MFRRVKIILNTCLIFAVLALGTVFGVYAAINGTVTTVCSVTYISPRGYLYDGADMNVAMKKQANSSASSYSTTDSTITTIIFDYWGTTYSSMFDWDLSSSTQVDNSDNANIRLFYNSSAKTIYVLSSNLIITDDCEHMFENFTKVTTINFYNFSSLGSRTHASMFKGCSSLSSLQNFSHVTTNLSTDTSYMFNGCSSLTTLDVSNFSTALVENMSCMFKGCSGLSSLDVSNFSVTIVTNFSEMFSGCSNLTTLNLTGFTTTAATTMAKMFYNCAKVTSLSLSNFVATNVTTFESMFEGCSKITSLDLSSFNTPNVTTFKKMFNNCTSLSTLNMGQISSESVTDMSYMFCETALTTLNIRYFNTRKVTNMEKMFYNITEITTIYVSNLWETYAVTSSSNIFTGNTNLVGGFGTTFSSSNIGLSMAHVDLPDSDGYLTAADVQYIGVYVYDELGNTISISYVGTESDYTLPSYDSEFDYYKDADNNQYSPGQTVQFATFSSKSKVEFTAYFKTYTITFSNGDYGSRVTKTVTYVNSSGSTVTVSSGSAVRAGVTVTISLDTSSGAYYDPEVSITSGVTLTEISEYEKYSFVMPKFNVTLTFSCSWCIAEGTEITLADGSKKAVEDLSMDDRILVFNHETGELDEAEINFIENDGRREYSVINLIFSNGVHSKYIEEHGLFDVDLNKYVYIHDYDCEDYIGHRYYSLNENGEHTIVELREAYAQVEYIGCYSFVTNYHLNYYTDGLLSMPGGISGLFNIFDYDENLKYDEEEKQQLIEQVGLLEYEELEEFVEEKYFYMYPTQYLKISMYKGLMTYEDLMYLINRYCQDD